MSYNDYMDDAPAVFVESDFDRGYSLGRLHGEQYAETKSEAEITKVRLDSSAKVLNADKNGFDRGFECGKREGSGPTPTVSKIELIKFVRDKFGLGLKEAKDLVDAGIMAPNEWGAIRILPLVEKIYEQGFRNGVEKARTEDAKTGKREGSGPFCGWCSQPVGQLIREGRYVPPPPGVAKAHADHAKPFSFSDILKKDD